MHIQPNTNGCVHTDVLWFLRCVEMCLLLLILVVTIPKISQTIGSNKTKTQHIIYFYFHNFFIFMIMNEYMKRKRELSTDYTNLGRKIFYSISYPKMYRTLPIFNVIYRIIEILFNKRIENFCSLCFKYCFDYSNISDNWVYNI